MHGPDIFVPTKALVLACVNSTPHDPIPRPYLVAQPGGLDGLELWNMDLPRTMDTMEVFEAFADAYLLRPKNELKFVFMPLARVETPTHVLRVFAANRLLNWQDFIRLDDKELFPLRSGRKANWTDMSQLAIDAAFRSEGMRLILSNHRMVQQGQVQARRNQIHLVADHAH
jgi:hypothetical protein